MYRISTEMNWVRLYRAMYLKTLNDVSREQRPSLGSGHGCGESRPRPAPPRPLPAPSLPYLMTMGTHSMLATLEVKGETTEASAWESEMPTSAAFSAPQSLAPSPHMPTQYLVGPEGGRPSSPASSGPTGTSVAGTRPPAPGPAGTAGGWLHPLPAGCLGNAREWGAVCPSKQVQLRCLRGLSSRTQRAESTRPFYERVLSTCAFRYLQGLLDSVPRRHQGLGCLLAGRTQGPQASRPFRPTRKHSLELLQFTHQLCLLLGRHTGKDGALDQHLGAQGGGRG